MSRPKFASRKMVDLENEDQLNQAKPDRAARGSDIITVDKKQAAQAVKGGISALWKGIMAIITIVIVLYLALAATLMFVAPGETGLTGVMRNTFAGGRPSDGDFIYASKSDEVVSGFGENLVQAFLGVKNPVVLEVVGGPHKNVSTKSNNEVMIEKEGTGYYANTNIKRLDNEYLAICIIGACEAGEVIILPHENIVGEAKGGVSTEGIGTYDSVRKQ